MRVRAVVGVAVCVILSSAVRLFFVFSVVF
jgi:hypothetical protein